MSSHPPAHQNCYNFPLTPLTVLPPESHFSPWRNSRLQHEQRTRRCAAHRLAWHVEGSGNSVQSARLSSRHPRMMSHRLGGISRTVVTPLHREYPNLALRVRRAMRLCEIPMLPARSKYVELFCALRNMQGAACAINPRKDVAVMLAALLFDWQNGGGEMCSHLRVCTSTINNESTSCLLGRRPASLDRPIARTRIHTQQRQQQRRRWRRKVGVGLDNLNVEAG